MRTVSCYAADCLQCSQEIEHLTIDVPLLCQWCEENMAKKIEYKGYDNDKTKAEERAAEVKGYVVEKTVSGKTRFFILKKEEKMKW